MGKPEPLAEPNGLEFSGADSSPERDDVNTGKVGDLSEAISPECFDWSDRRCVHGGDSRTQHAPAKRPDLTLSLS